MGVEATDKKERRILAQHSFLVHSLAEPIYLYFFLYLWFPKKGD